jgi:hypothetical protein
LFHAQKLGGSDSTVAGDDGVLVVNQDGVGETELFYAGSNLTDLMFRVGSGIARKGRQISLVGTLLLV